MASPHDSDGAVLRRAISSLHRVLRRQDGPLTIGPTSFGLLGLLALHGPSSASELAEREHLQPQSLTRALRSLEDAKLISRAVDEDDRRRAVLSITDEGTTLLRSTLRKRVAWLNQAIAAKLTDEERKTLRTATSLLERLAGTAEEPKRPTDNVFNLIPFMHVNDVERSVAFYERLGFTVDGVAVHGGKMEFASMHSRVVRAARIMLSHTADAIVHDGKICSYCWTDDIKALHQRLTAEGLFPTDIDYPDYMENGEFTIADPDGYVIRIGQPKR